MPDFVEDRCMDCGGCLGICPHDALAMDRGGARVVVRVLDACTECDLCVRLCPVDALLSVREAGTSA